MGSKWLSRGHCFENCMVAIMTYRISVTQMTTDVLRRSHNAVFVSTLMIYHSDLQTSNMTGATNEMLTECCYIYMEWSQWYWFSYFGQEVYINLQCDKQFEFFPFARNVPIMW
jgi:hypothetical protein